MAEAGLVDEFVPGSAAVTWAPLGALVAYPLGCACGTATVGRWQHRGGNTGLAYVGACAPGALAGLVYLAVNAAWPDAFESWILPSLLPTAAFVLTPVGAVIGYNTGVSHLGTRLAPPTLAYRTRLGPDRQRYSGFDCRLVTVRF